MSPGKNKHVGEDESPVVEKRQRKDRNSPAKAAAKDPDADMAENEEVEDMEEDDEEGGIRIGINFNPFLLKSTLN